MGLFDDDDEPADAGLFGAPAPPAKPVSAASLFDADDDGDEDAMGAPTAGGRPAVSAASLFGADDDGDEHTRVPAKSDASNIVASLFGAEDVDDDMEDFDAMVGGGAISADPEGVAGTGSPALSAEPDPETMYKVCAKGGAIIRASFEMDSPVIRTADKGEVLVALSKRVNSTGVLRVQFADGWGSQTTADGSVKLLHWMGSGEPDTESESESESDPDSRASSDSNSETSEGEESDASDAEVQLDLGTKIFGFFAPTHLAIAKMEAKQAKLVEQGLHAWCCGWCGYEEDPDDPVENKMHGPDGPDTLCGVCGSRYEDEWACGWCSCGRHETTEVLAGPDDVPQGLCVKCGTRYKAEQAADAKRLEAERKEAAAVAKADKELKAAQKAEQDAVDAEKRAKLEAEAATRAEESESERVQLNAQQARLEHYRVVNQAVVRVGFSTGSRQAERSVLRIGEVVEVLEERVDDNGLNRIHFSDGWVSENAGDGTPLLALGTEWWRVVEEAPIRVSERFPVRYTLYIV